ncbi:MAG TPA: N-acetyltransferase [Blastocatellia bacterium]|nr:N-acetyltransferase [Blastocatellia bacterium]
MSTIRAEQSEDHAAIRRVVELAFGQPNEADLVDALRKHAHPYISLVAVVDGQVVGHIFFSPVSIESGGDAFLAIGLAPMAVLPDYQNKGIGTELVQAGLRECRRLGHEVVVVLGHPKYYPRFGFVPASQRGIRSEYDVADEVFMVAELTPGALKGRQGLVKYHSEFSKV